MSFDPHCTNIYCALQQTITFNFTKQHLIRLQTGIYCPNIVTHVPLAKLRGVPIGKSWERVFPPKLTPSILLIKVFNLWHWCFVIILFFIHWFTDLYIRPIPNPQLVKANLRFLFIRKVLSSCSDSWLLSNYQSTYMLLFRLLYEILLTYKGLQLKHNPCLLELTRGGKIKLIAHPNSPTLIEPKPTNYYLG